MMTYMTYNFFFALMTLLPVLIWFGVSLWVILDAEKMTPEAWRLAGESKNVWIAISVLLTWPFGLIFYVFIVRKKVAAFAHAINEDTLIGKAADRLRKESDEKKAAHIPFSYPPVSEDNDEEENLSYQNPQLRQVMTSMEAVKTSHGNAVNSNDSEDQVYDYEESDARDDYNESEQVIPPKPNRAPTVGNDVSDENKDSETETSVYPVIPPKPNRAPRVGSDKAEG